MKRATSRTLKKTGTVKISIHALVKRATVCVCVNYYPGDDFNPRPREEGDLSYYEVLCKTNISIHALVKRATQVLNASWDKIFISIHALVKRATFNPLTIILPFPIFQSTPS